MNSRNLAMATIPVFTLSPVVNNQAISVEWKNLDISVENKSLINFTNESQINLIKEKAKEIFEVKSEIKLDKVEHTNLIEIELILPLSKKKINMKRQIFDEWWFEESGLSELDYILTYGSAL
ncbi:hypothetical protein [Facklamia hominis]|uniref:Uncharacterized protein n=1 Tax=Facklamia hominis CCUG 36813 TaxID=883111 RepID=K1LWG1_9LACT|nr:hypothetical protein [Facklamia hominis]EKB54443.1 hypothetical protein HMPREF9706_00633 [Facklamia hominis CCUG 36813]